MPYDDVIKLASEGTGKSVDMEKVATAAGDPVYRQRAVLVGETGVVLQQLLELNVQQLTVLRAILAVLNSTNGAGPVAESDFDEWFSPNNDR